MNASSICILGCGNIGSAIARGLEKSGHFSSGNIILTQRKVQSLEKFKKFLNSLELFNSEWTLNDVKHKLIPISESEIKLLNESIISNVLHTLDNRFNYSDLDSFIRPSRGININYFNTISPATNNENGYIKNLITYAKYYPYKKINVDYITESPFSFECKRITELQFSNTRDLAIGEIMGMHARKSLIDMKNYHVNWSKYHPIGRLFASHYIYTDNTLSMKIPPDSIFVT